MEFYQLEYLCAVADRGGYNQAARRPCRVSSAVKPGVALREQEVGVPLLRRDGRVVRLTEEGEEFVRWAHFAIERCGDIMDRIRKEEPLRSRVVVAAGQAINGDVKKELKILDTGVRIQDTCNAILKRGWTLGSAHLLKVLQTAVLLYHEEEVRLLQEHWSQTKPD